MTEKESSEEQQKALEEVSIEEIEEIVVGMTTENSLVTKETIKIIKFGKIGHDAAANKRRSMRMRDPKVRKKYSEGMRETLGPKKDAAELRRRTDS